MATALISLTISLTLLVACIIFLLWNTHELNKLLEELERLNEKRNRLTEKMNELNERIFNLVMKDAPSRRLLHANVTTGYNALYFDRDFLSFNHNDIRRKSPNETKGTTGDYGVNETDFTNANLRIKIGRAHV